MFKFHCKRENTTIFMEKKALGWTCGHPNSCKYLFFTVEKDDTGKGHIQTYL